MGDTKEIRLDYGSRLIDGVLRHALVNVPFPAEAWPLHLLVSSAAARGVIHDKSSCRESKTPLTDLQQNFCGCNSGSCKVC